MPKPKRQPAQSWLYPASAGLYCAPGNFYIDPHRPVDHAIITHGHADHARPGHGAVLATPETVDIMKVRYGQACASTFQTQRYGETTTINGVEVGFVPAGHILGSAQIVLTYDHTRIVVSGDYKRAADPTCAAFELVTCDVFVTEATFGLPVFRHEPADQEALKLATAVTAEPERTHLLGVYGLGKCQRMIKLLRLSGFDAPIYLHGALTKLTEYYESQGQTFGDVRPVAHQDREVFKGALVMCPPSAVADKWSRRFGDAVAVFASGWMRVRGRARQRGVEMPLIVSDHADWPELIDTIVATQAQDVWVTHGREDALVYHLGSLGISARALALVGRDDDEGE